MYIHISVYICIYIYMYIHVYIYVNSAYKPIIVVCTHCSYSFVHYKHVHALTQKNK